MQGVQEFYYAHIVSLHIRRKDRVCDLGVFGEGVFGGRGVRLNCGTAKIDGSSQVKKQVPALFEGSCSNQEISSPICLELKSGTKGKGHTMIPNPGIFSSFVFVSASSSKAKNAGKEPTVALMVCCCCSVNLHPCLHSRVDSNTATNSSPSILYPGRWLGQEQARAPAIAVNDSLRVCAAEIRRKNITQLHQLKATTKENYFYNINIFSSSKTKVVNQSERDSAHHDVRSPTQNIQVQLQLQL